MEATFNQWESFPINLNTNEIANPLNVISDFFSDDSLNGHLERLTQWRDYVLKDDYFRDHKESPAGLLYFYKLNLHLVEAANLIFRALPLELNAELIRENTFNELAEVLVGLSEAERLDLYAVLSGFFATYSLQQYREQLYEWLEHGLSRKGANEFITSIDLITVYENLQRLYSAAWLICQQLPEKLFLHDKDETVNSAAQKFSDATLYQLSTVILESLAKPIGQIVSVIKHKVPSVQAIYYLGASTMTPDKLYFLVFTSDDEQQHAHNLASTIDESCMEIIAVNTLVLQVSKLFIGIANGNRFFQQALSAPLVYLSGDRILPGLKKPEPFIMSEKTAFNWNRWFEQGKDFLSGAEFYISRKSFGSALFSLHQCAECLLTAIVKAVLDYNVGGHNLTKLLDMTEMFTQDIAAIFHLENEEKAKQFDVLKHAYVNVRYKDNYEPDESNIINLYPTIKKMVTVVETVYQKHLLINNL